MNETKPDHYAIAYDHMDGSGWDFYEIAVRYETLEEAKSAADDLSAANPKRGYMVYSADGQGAIIEADLHIRVTFPLFVLAAQKAARARLSKATGEQYPKYGQR